MAVRPATTVYYLENVLLAMITDDQPHIRQFELKS